MRRRARLLALAALSWTAAACHAGEVQVAVAANFSGPMAQLALDFEKVTGHKAVVAYGTVGKFYAQIRNGAPFEVLLSADDETPIRLQADQLAVPGTRFTYAIGKLVLWSAKAGVVDDQGEVLRRGSFQHLAIANPKVAVYGAAAIDAMKKLGVHDALAPRLVTGESITQAWQFIATGNAELGFVALSQVYREGQPVPGSMWMVPPSLYPLLKQDAVLLVRGKHNPAAAALLAYLQGDPARKVIRSFGYEL